MHLFSDDFRKQLEKAANTFKDNAQKAANVLEENAQKTTEVLKDKYEQGVDNGQLPDMTKVSEQIQNAFTGNKKAPVPDALDVMKAGSVTVPAAIRIFYYLVAADGEIRDDEKQRLDEIGQSLDEKFPEYKETLFQSCENELRQTIDLSDEYDILTEAVDRAILADVHENDQFLPARVLVWDMLAIAFCDGSFDKTERKLIRYVVRKYQIDYTLYLEMESSMSAVLDIEKELQWVKTTGRPYTQIEEIVNELNARKNAISESVQALAML